MPSKLTDDQLAFLRCYKLCMNAVGAFAVLEKLRKDDPELRNVTPGLDAVFDELEEVLGMYEIKYQALDKLRDVDVGAVGSAPTDQEIDFMIDQAKELIILIRTNVIQELSKAVRAICKMNDLNYSPSTVEKNFNIAVHHENPVEQKLMFAGNHVATIDWLKMMVYRVHSEEVN